ncbi:hypothetical protein R6Q59_010095 [Mikania micrantha]
MPPKQAKSGSSNQRSGLKGDGDVKEEPLRAVVVADTFETTFPPFTLERPRCLLPLANTPLIEYTLEFLASSGVQEVFVYAGRHVDQVEVYINASKWKASSSPFKKLVFLRCQANSIGDVMRDLDQKALMGAQGSDFLVVSGDIVAEVPVSQALIKHKERRDKDKNAIMTMILRERGVRENIPEGQIVPTFIVDPTKDRCLHYEESQWGADWGSTMDSEMLRNSEVEIRQDLIDCRIDICTPDVLSLWSDNFDNQTPRKDFLFGVLKDYELNGKTFHTYVVKDRYVNRVGDLRAYAEVTKDLQKRLITSMAPDNNVSNTNYTRGRYGNLRERDVIIARPSKIGPETIIGHGTSIGRNGNIEQSVLGRRCQIGKNCSIRSAYVWDDTTIGSNVKISHAIIASEAFIGDDCEIGEGALISFRVTVAPGTKVPAGARITKSDRISKKNTSIAGTTGGEGWEYQVQDDDEEGAPSCAYMYTNPELNDSVSSLGSEISAPSSQPGSRSQSFATTMSDEEPGNRFLHDTVSILVQRMQENKQADDMLSELMGLRFSGGADETQVRKAVTIALIKHIHSQIAAGTASAADSSRKTLEKYHALVKREDAEQARQEQVSFLLEAQKDLVNKSDGGKILLFIAKDLYDLEVFEEEAFTAWWADSRSTETPELSQIREPTAQFIQWLEEAESESESGEDEEDEDEEDDEED